MTSLWKYFQNCMYSFKENWEINLTIWHSVPRFNPSLFTISVKSKVLFRCLSEITRPTVDGSWHGFHLLDSERWIQLIPPRVRRTSPWLSNFSSISATICLLPKIFCQDNKFFYFKSISSFPTSACPEIFQNFHLLHLIRSTFHCLLKFSTSGT